MGNEDSFMMIEAGDGQLHRSYDHDRKRRRDHFVSDPELEAAVKDCLRDKVLHQVRLAFRYEVTRFEDFRIGCYSAEESGFFGPHRDDSTEGTAHRAFALSVILNAEDFEGGELRFPEFGPVDYKPASGDAIVFSSALLHEVTPVTAGRRFSLISFLYGETESQRRKNYYIKQLLGDSAIADSRRLD
jgi:predicted 2-oxoglutarate/Fe(II)-dependent dioxygenase YbiX